MMTTGHVSNDGEDNNGHIRDDHDNDSRSHKR